MGFTTILAVIYAVLLIVAVSALFIGIKHNEWALFIGVIIFIIILTAVLAYFWIKSPM